MKITLLKLQHYHKSNAWNIDVDVDTSLAPLLIQDATR